MSLASRRRLGQGERTQVMALKKGYHGETMLTLALSDIDAFKKEYAPLLPAVELIDAIPYVNSSQAPGWIDCSTQWTVIEKQLDAQKEHLSAIVFEPIVQGAGGMLLYSKDFLFRLRAWATANDVHLIADEIMTGFGRTGLPLACMHAGIEPDFLCLAKNLTAGWLPMSAVLTTDTIYDLFYDEPETGKAFLHSHTHSGNALAAAVALACFDVMAEEGIYARLPELAQRLHAGMTYVQSTTQQLKNIRSIGGIVAAEINTNKQPGLAQAITQEALRLGVLLRPIGNTLYWLPPLNISWKEINQLTEITTQAIQQAVAKTRVLG
jgi:adenosylmethionine-8-amino-7-oxononanoate aminotransferase